MSGEFKKYFPSYNIQKRKEYERCSKQQFLQNCQFWFSEMIYLHQSFLEMRAYINKQVSSAIPTPLANIQNIT